MAWRAGEIITAARLSQRSDSAKLDDYTIEEKGEWEDWSDERVEFDNPGVDVTVKAWLSGEAEKSSNKDSSSLVQVRMSVSFDDGDSWEEGPSVGQFVGGDASNIEMISGTYFRSGDPDGTILIKAEVKADSTNTSFNQGNLMAEMVPE